MHGLVLISTGPGFRRSAARLKWNATASKIASRYEKKGMDALVGSDREKGHRSVDGIIRCCRFMYTQRDDDPLYVELGGPHIVYQKLGDVEIPCAIIVGERDRAFYRASLIMAKSIPNATIDVIESAGHMAVEKNAETFNGALLRALHRLSGVSNAARL